MYQLLPEALGDALGQVLADTHHEWQKDVEYIRAESRAIFAELRTEIATLKVQNAELVTKNAEQQRLMQEHVAQQLSLIREAQSHVKDGRDGVDGLPGPQGEKGEAGPAGEKGEQGERGETGPRGEAGPQGEKGEAGLIGPAGDKGEPGNDPDTEEIVQKVLALMPEPKRGERGEKGEIGPAGQDGKDGEVGPQGTAGRDGIDGAPGEKGDRGDTGPEGVPGRDGAQLVREFVDRDGVLVLTLSDGSVREVGHVVGRDGAPGKDGKDGIDGKDGRDGFGFDDLEFEHDGERGFVFRFVRGEQVKEFPFSVPVAIDRGVYREGLEYRHGDGVTYGGSLWIAQKDAPEGKPDNGNGSWRLAVKRGRDGKDGERGPPGKDGRDLKS